MKRRFDMPHPAIVCSGPQLDSVIAELEAGTYPQTEDAIWRDDLPHDTAVRLAKATGATDVQIAEICDPKRECTAEEGQRWQDQYGDGYQSGRGDARSNTIRHELLLDVPPEVPGETGSRYVARYVGLAWRIGYSDAVRFETAGR